MKHILSLTAMFLVVAGLNAQDRKPAPADSIRDIEQVVITAGRVAQQRSEAPVAIATVSRRTIEETRAQTMDLLLNKVSGVYNNNLGNEQHSMSIRQPITTKSLFLYLEDGIPIRTTGVFNHNALLELNLPAAERIEVIKGPSSSLYGAEAIGGVVNVITESPSEKPSGYLNVQRNNNGYFRSDARFGMTKGKFGIILSGYYAQRRSGQTEYSDFDKKAFSAKAVYAFTDRTKWTNALAYVDYYSDMTGGLDSIKFSRRDFSTFHTFTYRAVESFRYRSTFEHVWAEGRVTSMTFMYRDNSIAQNPSYSVWSTSNPLRYRGQINDNAFSTTALFLQHVHPLKKLKGRLVAGGNIDRSPQTYMAEFIWIDRATPTGKFTGYSRPAKDSLLNDYRTNILNTAAFAQLEFTPFKRLRVVGSVRYDDFRYDFRNSLPPSATSGGPSSVQHFSRFTPKVGATYNIKGIGFYANYSEGYVPPQLNELFNSVKTPYLRPQTFRNTELGGWMSLWGDRLYADWSLYALEGSNEIISVRQADGTNVNQNSGRSMHKGIEYGIRYKAGEQLSVRFSGTNARHSFTDYVVRGVSFNGKEMSGSPRFMANAEATWRPAFAKGLRVGAEWQRLGRYFMDDTNLFTYSGFDLVHARIGYQRKWMDLWLNVLNLTNAYYATSVTKSTASGNASYSYNLGMPREITLGFGVKF